MQPQPSPLFFPPIQFQSPANLSLKLLCLTYWLHLHLLLFSLKLFKSAPHPCSPVTALRLPPGAPGCDARDLHSFSVGGKELELCGCPRVCGDMERGEIMTEILFPECLDQNKLVLLKHDLAPLCYWQGLICNFQCEVLSLQRPVLDELSWCQRTENFTYTASVNEQGSGSHLQPQRGERVPTQHSARVCTQPHCHLAALLNSSPLK